MCSNFENPETVTKCTTEFEHGQKQMWPLKRQLRLTTLSQAKTTWVTNESIMIVQFPEF
jgi:hypothetical protein